MHNTKAYDVVEVQPHSKTRQWLEVSGHLQALAVFSTVCVPIPIEEKVSLAPESVLKLLCSSKSLETVGNRTTVPQGFSP
jgi:hypothetical protein